MAYKEYTDRNNKEVLISDLNNMFNSNYYYIKDDDLSITITDDLEITIGAGTAIFGSTETAIVETQVPISAADDDNDRIDIITVEDDGTISVFEGAPALQPETPSYDAETLMCLCSVRVKKKASALTSDMVNPNFILKKTPIVAYTNEQMSDFIHYQNMEILEVEALNTMGITTETMVIVNDSFINEDGLLESVNTANTTSTFKNYRYYNSGATSFVEIDLPAGITGVTYSALIVRWEKAYDDTITYELDDGANQDSNMAIETKNAKTLVTAPTILRINLNQGATAVPKYPKIFGFCLILYK